MYYNFAGQFIQWAKWRITYRQESLNKLRQLDWSSHVTLTAVIFSILVNIFISFGTQLFYLFTILSMFVHYVTQNILSSLQGRQFLKITTLNAYQKAIGYGKNKKNTMTYISKCSLILKHINWTTSPDCRASGVFVPCVV